MPIELSPAVAGISLTLIGAIIGVAIKIHMSSRDIEKTAGIVESMHLEQTRMAVLVGQHEEQIAAWRDLASDRHALIASIGEQTKRLAKDFETLAESVHKLRGTVQAQISDLHIKLRMRRSDGGE